MEKQRTGRIHGSGTQAVTQAPARSLMTCGCHFEIFNFIFEFVFCTRGSAFSFCTGPGHSRTQPAGV